MSIAAPTDTRSIQRQLSILSVLVYFLIAIGGTVRNLNAGLSCPDWPLCFGKIIPHFDIQIFAEFFHRLIAGMVSLLFLFLVVKISLSKAWRAILGRLSIIAVLILASQIVLGGLTVLHLLKSEVVTLHLAAGTLFFGVILLMSLRAKRFSHSPSMYTIAKDKKRDVPTHVWRYGLAALAMVYLQIVLGGMVSSNGAALACEGFPLCSGQWWPGFEGLVGIQFLHRIGAVGALVIVSAFIYQIKSKKALPDEKNKAPLFMGLVILTQWGLGIGNVLFNLPFWMSIAHLAVAQLLFALVLSTTYEIRHHQLHQTH